MNRVCLNNCFFSKDFSFKKFMIKEEEELPCIFFCYFLSLILRSDVAAFTIGFFCLLIEADRGLVKVITFLHKFIHCFTSFQQILQVIVHNILHLLELTLDSKQFVGLERILPFA